MATNNFVGQDGMRKTFLIDFTDISSDSRFGFELSQLIIRFVILRQTCSKYVNIQAIILFMSPIKKTKPIITIL